MVKRVTALQARHNLGEILEGVYHRGDQFVIERAGKPMAVVVPLHVLPEYEALDKDIAVALDDIKKGRLYGPFSSAEDAVRSLRRPTARRKARSTKKR